jgi:phage terminase large subunit
LELTIDTTITFDNILSSKYKVVHNVGGTRSSKSYSALQYCIVQAIQKPTIVTIVRKSIPSLKRTIIKDFKDILEHLNIWHEEDFNVTDRVWSYEKSIIQFISTDDAEKLRGIKSDILFIDEANEIDEESYFQLSIRTKDKIILCYNPTISPYHWLRQMQDCDRYVTTYLDNPYLDKEIVKGIEELKNKNEKYWKIYGLGEYTANDKAIFEFNIVDDFDADFVSFGLDFGFSSDPSAMVAVYKKGDELFMEEVFYEKGLVTNEIIDKLKKGNIDKSYEIFGDSSEPRLIEEIFRSGFNIKPVTKGPDSIKFGIAVMNNYKINILKSSQNLINEMYGYEYITDKNGNVTDKPQDYMNHAIDAARYACMMKLSQKQQSKGRYALTIGQHKY